MIICTRLDLFKPDSNKPLFLALGNFDGVHVGHQKILKSIIAEAKRGNGIPAVLTFFENPQRILRHSQPPAILTSTQHRLFLFYENGIELCFLTHFTLPFSKTSPENFVEDVLVRKLAARQIRLGYNAHFGAGRQGDSSLMRQLAHRFSFDFYEEEPVEAEGEFVSSTLIRKFVNQGDLRRAEVFLGRPFGIFASVVRGRGRGLDLGFPTANLKPHSEILPPRGVYAVRVREKLYHLKPVSGTYEFEYVLEEPGEWYGGVLNFGTRPTFQDADDSVHPEVHLIDFEGDLYGKTVEVIFRLKLREELRFKSAAELSRAIQKDVENAREYFHSNASG